MDRVMFPKGPIGLRMLGYLALSATLFTLSGSEAIAQAEPPKVIERPIRFDAERRALTLAYRRAHSDPAATDIRIRPELIVIHHTAFPRLEDAWRYFDRITIEAGRKKIARAGRVNVSAHYLVDRDGTIYRLMPETWMARHCIGLNHVAIGIENVGGTKDAPLTEAQLTANDALVRDIARRHSITRLIGHHEYRLLEDQPYFRELDPSYRTTKIDPGAAFMRRLRARVSDLGLGDASRR